MPRGYLINTLTGQTGGNRRKKDEEQSTSSAASPVVKPAQQRQQTQQYTDTGSNGVRQAEQVYSSSAGSALPQTQTERNPFERLIDLATDTPQWQAAQQYNAAEQKARENNLPSQSDYWLSQQPEQPAVKPAEQEEKESALDRFVRELTLTKQEQKKRNRAEEKQPAQESNVVRDLVGQGFQALQNSPGAEALGSDRQTLEQERAQAEERLKYYQGILNKYANQQADAESNLFYATDDYGMYDSRLRDAKAGQAQAEKEMAAIRAQLDKLNQALQFREGLDNQQALEDLETGAREAKDFDARRSSFDGANLQAAMQAWEAADNRQLRDPAYAQREAMKAYAEQVGDIQRGRDLEITSYGLTPEQQQAFQIAEALRYLSDDEAGTYLYYLATNADKAAEYWKLLGADERKANARTEQRYGKSGDSFWRQLGNAAYAIGDNLSSGTTRALVGMDTMFNSGAPAYDDGMAEANARAAKLHNDSILWRSMTGAAQSVGQMIPSMMAGQYAGMAAAPFSGAVNAGKVGQYASNAAFFSSIQGNAAAEAREKYGMGAKASNVYGTLVAATEVGLQSAIGGIAQFGGISETQLMDRIELIDNALLRAAAKYGANVAGELTEEELQNYLEPFYVSLLTGQEYELPTLQENLETALATVMMVTATGSGAEFASDLNQARAEAVQNAGLDFSDAGLQESWGMFGTNDSASANRQAMNDAALNELAAQGMTEQNFQDVTTPEQRQQMADELTAEAGRTNARQQAEALAAQQAAAEAAPVQEQAAPAQMQVQTAPAEQTAPAAVQNAAVTEGKSRPIQVDNAQRAQGTGEQRVSEAYDTITESPAIPDEFTQRVLKPSMENGEFNMTPDTNKAQLERGRSWVDEKLATNTVGDTVAAWKTLVSQGGTKTVNAKTLQAAGYTLLNRLANAAENTSLSDQQRREYDMLGVQVATNLQKVASNAGQLLQMQTMLQKMTPEMQIYSTKSAVEQLNETLSRRGVQVTLDQSLVNNLRRALESGDEAAISEARDALYSNIAEQMPMNVMDKLNAWRYLCMLGNPTTLIRNFFGNVGFMPVKAASGKVQAAVQSVLQKSGAIAQEQRTKYGGVLNASAEGRALLKWGKEYAAQLDSELSGEGKYTRTENAGTAIDKAWHEYNSQFKNPVLRGWQKATEFGLNSSVMGDALFLGHHFSNEIAQMAMARGYHLDANGQLVTKTGEAVSREQMNDMTQRAIQEAKKATYRDTNAFTTLMKKMRSDSMSTGARVRNTLVDAVFPFISTPANIVARSVEYGPIGLAKTLLLETGKLRSGEISATDYVADLCDGLTGSGIVALGAYLASQGLLTGAVVDDDDKREGKQKYSLNILGQHIPIDWLAPEAAVLLAGATLYEGFQSDGSKGLDSLYNMFGSYLDPIVQTSMLSGVSDLLDSKSYTTEPGSEHANLLYALTINAFMNYASQYIPTMWGKGTASARDQKTYIYTGDVEGNINKQWARTWGNFEKKLGVDVFGGQTRQQPSLDDWGRPTETGSVGQRLVQNYLLPYSATEDRTTPRDEAIRSLNDDLRAAGLETGTQSVGPSKRGYTVNVKNAETGNTETVRLSGDQYTAYQRTYGETWAKLYDEVLEDPRYQSMTAAQKQAMLDTLDTVANERGKEAAGVGYTTDNKIAALMDEGLSFADAYDVAQWKSSGKDGEDRGVDAPRSAELWAYTAHIPGSEGMEETALTQEMRRVFEANGEQRYFAANAPDEVSVGLDTGEKVELNDQQKQAYMDQRGVVFENLANTLLEDSRYQDASDEEKLSMLRQAYTLAGESAKDSLGVGYESNSKEYSLLQTGLSAADIYTAKAYHNEVDEMLKESDNEDLGTQRLSTNARAATYKAWVDGQDWTREQKDAVLEKYGTFYSMRGSDTEKYDAMTANGFTGDQAADLLRKLSSLEPLEGAGSVSDAQRWELIVNSDLTPEQKNTAMWLQMDKSQRARFERFMDSGLGAEDYYKIYAAKATHGNEKGNWTVDTLEKYLKANYTPQQSYFIWPLFSTGKNRFSRYASAPAEHQGGIPELAEETAEATAAADSSAAPQNDNSGSAGAESAGNAGGSTGTGSASAGNDSPEVQAQVDAALDKYRHNRMLSYEEWLLLFERGLLD